MPPTFPTYGTCMCVCVCVCMCVCVCVHREGFICLDHLTTREQINDVALKTFISYAKFLHRYIIM